MSNKFDRYVEQHLWLALKACFNRPAADATEIMADVEVMHPYGSVGPLPRQFERGQPMPLGGGDGLDVRQVSSRTTHSRQSVESEVEPRIRAAPGDAATILTLGFGYSDRNEQPLTPGEKRNANCIIISALSVSQLDHAIILDVMDGFARPTDPQIMLEPGICRDLFNNPSAATHPALAPDTGFPLYRPGPTKHAAPWWIA